MDIRSLGLRDIRERVILRGLILRSLRVYLQNGGTISYVVHKPKTRHQYEVCVSTSNINNHMFIGLNWELSHSVCNCE